MEEDADWPTPSSAPNAEAWIGVLASALPNCITGAEMDALAAEGLVDCSVGGYDGSPRYERECFTTCGSHFSIFYYGGFFAVAAFVLLQLVIAVLMEQLNKVGRVARIVRPRQG